MITSTKFPKDSPLSPSDVTTSDQHATITGVLASLSPLKPSRYFDGELTDGQSIICVVGFDKAKQQELQSFCDCSIPVTLRNCHIQQNKFKNCFEVVLKTHTKIEPSRTQFDVPDLKTAGSSVIQLDKVNQLPQHERVTIKVSVVKVNEPQTVPGGKVKQDVVVVDSTAKATVTLWESNIGLLKQQKSYQLSRLEIRSYEGKQYLAFPSTPSIDEITDLKETIEVTTSSDETDEEVLRGVTVSGIKQLETVYTCINCNKNVHSLNAHIGECNACSITQKLTQPKQTAKLIIETGTKKYLLKAYDECHY